MTMAGRLNRSEILLSSVRGNPLRGLEQVAQGVWDFSFENGGLNVSCPWRLVDSGTVVLSGSDHGHKFGLPDPLDVQAQTLRILSGKVVENIRIDEGTADLSITFSGRARIDVFNNSGGYEGWQFSDH